MISSDSQIDFVFVDHEEWLTPVMTKSSLISEEVRNALADSVVIEFEGALFCHQSVSDPDFATTGYGSGERMVLVETKPTSFRELAP